MTKYWILGDIHGSKYWYEEIVPLKDYWDKLIIMGDYCDSYTNVSREEEIENLKQIIQFKKNHPDKVILLLGNHDINSYILDEYVSRHALSKYASQIKQILLDNKDCFQITYKIGDYIASHAGITKTWMRENNIKMLDEINKLYKQEKYEIFRWYPNSWFDDNGDSITQSPMWVRPNSLIKDAMYKKQIVGHSKIAPEKSHFILQDKSKDIDVDIYFTDNALENRNRLELCVE